MSFGEIALLVGLGVVAAAGVCWLAVSVAVRRVRKEGGRDVHRARPGRV
jgi:hypothetical protein